MQDQVMMDNILTSVKNACDIFMHGTIESPTPNVNAAFKQALNDCLCMQSEIACNCEGNYEDVKTGEYYNRQTRLSGVCEDGWTPDIVVINIGTNDVCGNAKDDEFITAAHDLLDKVRARYNDAHILWVYGCMTQRFADTIRHIIRERSETDKKLHFLFVDSINGNPAENGAACHPNVRASMRVSNCVYKKIRSITGWRGNVSEIEE